MVVLTEYATTTYIFNKIEALIPGVMNILLDPVLLQSPLVIIAVCKALDRLLWCKQKRNYAEESELFASLLASNVFTTHHKDPAVQLSLFKLLQLFPTYDGKVAVERNFGGMLHTQLSNHLENVEMVQLIMQCAFHYVKNLNVFPQGLKMDNSQVLHFICDDVFNKYRSNVDIMKRFCMVVEHCCNGNSSQANINKRLLSELGYCERLIEIHNMYEKMEGSSEIALSRLCKVAMVYLRFQNTHPSALKLLAYK